MNVNDLLKLEIKMTLLMNNIKRFIFTWIGNIVCLLIVCLIWIAKWIFKKDKEG